MVDWRELSSAREAQCTGGTGGTELAQIDVTRRLASFAGELSYEALPSDVVERGRMFLLDGAAVMVAAAAYARENGDRMLVNYLKAVAPPDGPSTVVGHGIRTSPMMAAFANGCMMEVLDYSDSNLGNLTHNGTPVLPAALAVAEHVSAPWGELCAAIVAGYEVHTRLLTTVQPGHWYRGFQSAGTFGTSGAAVAAGRLLGLDASGIAAALGVSGFIMPVSNGDNEFRGHSAKPVHGGQGATCGVSSAFLAQSGYRAGPLEGEPPRYHAALHILSDGPDLERALEGFAEKWHSRGRGLQALSPRPPDRRARGGGARPPRRGPDRGGRGRLRGHRDLPGGGSRLRQEVLDPREQLRRLPFLHAVLRRRDAHREGDDTAPASQRLHREPAGARAGFAGGGHGGPRDERPVPGRMAARGGRADARRHDPVAGVSTRSNGRTPGRRRGRSSRRSSSWR